jgi:DNA-binding GntR family transcriptional regulator
MTAAIAERDACMVLTDAQRAYSQIRERIITTALKPGSVIEEAELMVELGLGRTPIREALKLLEAERLVVVSPRRGIFVADVTLTDLRQIEEIRLELDSLCVRLAVQRMTSTQLEEMRRLVAELEQVAGEYSQADLLNLDRRFHALLREACHNRLLEAECKMFFNLSMRIWYLFVDRLTPESLAEDAFAEILAAVETKDVQRADRAMRRHILQFGEVVKQYI